MFAKKNVGEKKEKLAFKKHPITQSGKNHPPLMLQNSFFAVPVLICRKSAQAGGRQRVKEMGPFVEQSSCLAQTSMNNETLRAIKCATDVKNRENN